MMPRNRLEMQDKGNILRQSNKYSNGYNQRQNSGGGKAFVFERQTSLDKYDPSTGYRSQNLKRSPNQYEKDSQVNSKVVSKANGFNSSAFNGQSDIDERLAFIIQKLEVASRPITFETIDFILKNKEADKLIEQLSGVAVTEEMRSQKTQQLEKYLACLEKLAHHWKLIQQSKYEYRCKSYGSYDQNIVMVPHDASSRSKLSGPFLSAKTLLSSCMKPVAETKQRQKISQAGKEYFQHAASLQLHFFELTALIKNKFRIEKLNDTSNEYGEGSGGFLDNLMSLFTT